jgi:hypothetical protein
MEKTMFRFEKLEVWAPSGWVAFHVPRQGLRNATEGVPYSADFSEGLKTSNP